MWLKNKQLFHRMDENTIWVWYPFFFLLQITTVNIKSNSENFLNCDKQNTIQKLNYLIVLSPLYYVHYIQFILLIQFDWLVIRTTAETHNLNDWLYEKFKRTKIAIFAIINSKMRECLIE